MRSFVDRSLSLSLPLVVAATATAAATGAAPASTSRVAVAPKASTLGLGADLSFKMAPLVSLRLSGQRFDYERRETIDDVPYDIELGLQSLGATIDVHPFGGSFHLSAGLLANGNEIHSRGELEPTTSYSIGGATFTGAELGDVRGDVQFDPTAPYAGVGWGNPFSRQRRLGVSFDLGVIYQGSPDVTLTAENPLALPAVDQQMEQEERALEEDFENFEFFPVVSLGLSIRF